MSDAREQPLTYGGAGVDVAEGNRLVELIKPLAASTRRAGADASLGGFGGIFDLARTGYRDPLLVAATDGVGTKLKLASELGRLDGVGIDLVAMCVNDLVVQGAEPLFFLDYLATAHLEAEEARVILKGVAEGCRQAGAALIGGETAEMPGVYAPGDYDLAGFAVGAVERERLLPRGDVAEGDVIIGLASSGLHSNGFSLVRKLLARGRYDLAAPPPFDDEAESLEGALTRPTRIYVRSLLDLLASTGAIKALAHITGGGLAENVARVLPSGSSAEIELGGDMVPGIFRWIAKEGPVEEDEMLHAFNCGVGMAAIAAEPDVDGVLERLTEAGERTWTIGHVVPAERAATRIFGGL